MRLGLYATLSLLSFNLQANVLQYFAGISYSNPAELFKEQNNAVILGGMGMAVNASFYGTVLNLNNFQYQFGRNHSNRVSVLPFGRIAKRVDKRMVFGVDVTEPFHSNLVWGGRPFTRYASTETLMTDVDVSPRFSYSVTKKVFVGAGLNCNFLKNNETNWALPIDETRYTTLINRTSGFGLGYDTGLYLVFNQNNFFGATYYSSIKQKTRGESAFNMNISDDLAFNFRMPATTILNYVHIFSPKWLVSLQGFRSQWNENQYARIRNTAAPPPFPKTFIFTMHYKPSHAFAAALRNQWSEKWGLTFIGMVDDGPEHAQLRTINFPSDKQYFMALSGDYKVNKTTTLQMLYGEVFSNTLFFNKINLGRTVPFTTGRVDIAAAVFDLRIKIQA